MISTRGRYALRMMLDLAQNQGDGYVALRDIAARQEISKKYLEQIVPILNRAKVLKTNRGYQGGYQLAQSPDHYTVGMILRLTEGSLAPVSCVDGSDCCDRVDHCVTVDVWRQIQEAVSSVVDHITLRDLVEQYHQKTQDQANP